MAPPITLESPLVRTYIVYTAVLCAKMLAMSVLTALQRLKRGVVANPEDALLSSSKIKYDDKDVERVRRAHLNDLENIPVFIVLGFLYILTGPPAGFATTLFRLSAAARVLHTVVYAVVVVPQPARGFAWGVSYFISCYMAYKVIGHFVGAL